MDEIALNKNRDFHIFVAGKIVSAVGDGVSFVALPLLVLAITGSLAQMGLVSALSGIGRLVGGMVSGLVADNLDRRRLLVICDVALFVLHSSIPLFWWAGLAHIWVIYAVAFLGGGFVTCSWIVQIAAVPSLVGRSQLTAANGRLIAGQGAGLLLGPMLGGALGDALGTAMAIGVDGLTFAVSALSMVFIRLRALPDEAADAEGSGKRDYLDGFRFLWQQPTLRAVAFLSMSSMLLFVASQALFIFHLKENLGQGESAVGLVFGAAAFGALLSGTFASVLRRWLGFGAAFLGSLVVQGVFVILTGQAGTFVMFTVFGLFFALTNTLTRIYAMTLRQEVTPDQLLGRATAAMWLLNTVIGPPGAMGSTLLAERIGVPSVLAILGAIAIATGCIGIFTPASQRVPPGVR